MEKKKNKGGFRLPLSAYITYLLIACLLSTGVTLAKYISTSGSSDSASVAKFEVFPRVTSSQGDLSIDCSYVYSSTANYVFEVVNNSEVAVSYTVIVKMPRWFNQQGIQIKLNGLDPVNQGGLSYMVGDGEIVYTFEPNDVIPPRTIREGVTLSFVGDRTIGYTEETVEGITVDVIAQQVD